VAPVCGHRGPVRSFLPLEDREGDDRAGTWAMSDRFRVLVADPDPATRRQVCEALQTGTCEVVAEAGTAAAAVAAAQHDRPDVCLLDTRLPGGGLRAAADISSSLPGTAVVMMSGSLDDEDLFAALRLGAAGYLLKDTDPTRLCAALHGALSGEALLSRRLVRRLVDEFRTMPRRQIPLPSTHAPARLTEREAEVLHLMAGGSSTEEIARHLFLAPVTVRTHVSAILRKLHVPDREAAISLARRCPAED
jgi:DNA-binding NarL/FixJ family response regulator